MVGFNFFLTIITTFSSFLDEKTFTKLNLYVGWGYCYAYGWLPVYPPTIRRRLDR